MTALQLARDLIRRHEGFRAYAYDDDSGQPLQPGMALRGHPSVGYGRCLDLKGVTEREAEMMLETDLNDAFAGVVRFAGDALDGLGPVRQAVLVDVAVNVGTTGLMRFTQLQAAILRGDMEAAAVELLDSQAARRAPSRYEELARLWREAEDVA